ncbi:Glycosyl hydrolase family 115 [Evansella caseinilytica]|uniref:Glycosyl hydrolase family 115 n=1 Tax=Evansella caseinilytica TaxID=1503961 RepID=A0A1H3TCP8_9BACI|nr:glycosyl hydrolase 115 family protein [Evansella caseinilytica]SDZ47727.1 Glycosyl hydrolase family 115 [Evansella caseinilytica]
MFLLSHATAIVAPTNLAKPVQYGLQMLVRDMEKVFGQKPQVNAGTSEWTIELRYASEEECSSLEEEAFRLHFQMGDGNSVMTIVGRDDLGLVYGMLHISKKYLEIDPFWFWAEIPVSRKEAVWIPAEEQESARPAVRYRGWFVNDEVCLIGWRKEYPPTEEIWFPVFETLLRCGGNMVIPGTDLPRSGIHHQLAHDMGLWVTHHHAEPLGAEMFLRAYPGVTPSYAQHPELFERLWREAIEKQKDEKIIWVLSFRGQGDAPFWSMDPVFDTPEKRGAMISKVVWRQYELIKEYVKHPVCCIALYGEISELYSGGYLDLPPDVIKVWADNGYGKMVSRRQGNENFRISSLPELSDSGKHGIYYHITFHDLQASNHFTMSPYSPQLMKQEIAAAFQAKANTYLLLNSGNIRQHLYTLDIVSEIWCFGTIDLEKQLCSYLRRFFSSHHQEMQELYERYFQSAIAYGKEEDEKAGEEFYHHPARKIISHWLTGKVDQTNEQLIWATGNVSFADQVRWYQQKCAAGSRRWSRLKKRGQEVMELLSEEDKIRFYDQFLFAIELHDTGCRGAVNLCQAYFAFKEEKYPLAFVHASQAHWDYREGLEALTRSEHGKWKNFYRLDVLTNIKSTVDNVDTLRRFIRMFGDSPDFFLWYKQYLMPETEKYIYLENTHRAVLEDDELARMLKKKFAADGKLPETGEAFK